MSYCYGRDIELDGLDGFEDDTTLCLKLFNRHYFREESDEEVSDEEEVEEEEESEGYDLYWAKENIILSFLLHVSSII